MFEKGLGAARRIRRQAQDQLNKRGPKLKDKLKETASAAKMHTANAAMDTAGAAQRAGEAFNKTGPGQAGQAVAGAMHSTAQNYPRAAKAVGAAGALGVGAAGVGAAMGAAEDSETTQKATLASQMLIEKGMSPRSAQQLMMGLGVESPEELAQGVGMMTKKLYAEDPEGFAAAVGTELPMEEWTPIEYLKAAKITTQTLMSQMQQ